MKILAIETSCDETALALVEAEGGFTKPKFKVLKSIVASQIKIHRPFGGVVPNLAKREHIKNLPILYRKIFSDKQPAYRTGRQVTSDKKKIDAIAVTVGPGLEPALWTGINFAKELAQKLNKPLIGANHLEGHLYSFLLPTKSSKSYKLTANSFFPLIALLVSGGHTILLKMDNLKIWKKLGETRDDAVGEAFDKVARLLQLPYPGGPEIEKMARKGNPNAIPFPRPMIHDKNYDFSFSGLKTSVLYYLRDKGKGLRGKEDANSADVAASFQQAATDVLVAKTARAVQEFHAKTVTLCGGVAANRYLRKSLAKKSHELGVQFLVPEFEFNTDNASMIAAAAYFTYLRKKKYKLEAQGNLNL